VAARWRRATKAERQRQARVAVASRWKNTTKGPAQRGREEGGGGAVGEAEVESLNVADKDVRRRLAFIRYLHRVGLEQSQQPEPLQSASILTFHDAVELFLHLVFEDRGGGGALPGFNEYWDRIATAAKPVVLGSKVSMGKLNRARVSLKHFGQFPSPGDVEEFRGSVTSFLQDNTRVAFDADFDTFSMVDLVVSNAVREPLQAAEQAIAANDLSNAAIKIATAFRVLLDENDVARDLVPEQPHRPPPRYGTPLEEQSRATHDQWTGDAVRSLTSAVRVLTLGLDFRRYRRFQRLMPRVGGGIGGEYYVIGGVHPPSAELCQECLAFVVDCALRVQQ
jgi:hypothetical protein